MIVWDDFADSIHGKEGISYFVVLRFSQSALRKIGMVDGPKSQVLVSRNKWIFALSLAELGTMDLEHLEHIMGVA